MSAKYKNVFVRYGIDGYAIVQDSKMVGGPVEPDEVSAPTYMRYNAKGEAKIFTEDQMATMNKGMWFKSQKEALDHDRAETANELKKVKQQQKDNAKDAA